MMKHRTVRGRILYTSNKPGREGQERGRERFTMRQHTDGKVTISAQCEIDEPDPTVLRDVIYSIDENGRPMDCHVRLTIGDAFMGSGWFRFGQGFIECESYGPSIGRLSQTLPVDDYEGFGTHPIICDAYMTKLMDTTRGPHKRHFRCYVPSVDHRGASPPMIAETNLYMEYVGDETITTPYLGTLACRHFRFSDEDGGMVSKDGAHPTYDMWVTADDDHLFVRGGVGGYMQTWYELVELER